VAVRVPVGSRGYIGMLLCQRLAIRPSRPFSMDLGPLIMAGVVTVAKFVNFRHVGGHNTTAGTALESIFLINDLRN
jgi:hypothetical protein